MAAVLISRVQRTAPPKRGKRRAHPRYIVGLFSVADGPMSAEMSAALAERQALRESRAMTLAVKTSRRASHGANGWARLPRPTQSAAAG